mmetsp:Transcript_126615/g.233141  ORF Transcript_126615/g.233141 Transcript_126615/m.233141 type:complete len:457 (+) Transcript_126615:40-1410(+)
MWKDNQFISFEYSCLYDYPYSFLYAQIAMVFSMAVVIGLVLACIWGAGCPKRSFESKAAPAAVRPMPPMLTLDLIRTLVIANIIFLHGRCSWRFLVRNGIDGMVIISGFVNFLSTSNKIAQFDVPSGAAFLARRVSRLLPGYYIILIWCANQGTPDEPNISWPLNGLCLQSLTPVRMCHQHLWLPFRATGHGWYVSMTLIHTLFFPFVYNKMAYCSSWRSLACAFISVVALHWFIFNVLVNTWANSLADPNFAIGYRLLQLFMGMLVAKFTCMVPPGFLQHKIWWLILPLALGLAFDVKWYNKLHGDLFQVIPFLYNEMWPLSWCLVIVAAKAVAEQSVAEKGKDESRETSTLLRLVSWLVGAPCQWISYLAKYSYGAYLYQRIAHHFLGWDWYEHSADVCYLPVLISWALAIPSEYYVEKPVMQAVEWLIKTRIATKARDPYQELTGSVSKALLK